MEKLSFYIIYIHYNSIWLRYCGGTGSGEKLESRLGFPTIASGRVTITLNVVHQVEEPFITLLMSTLSRQKHFWWGAIQVEVGDATTGSF